jgi:hypothetical protein
VVEVGQRDHGAQRGQRLLVPSRVGRGGADQVVQRQRRPRRVVRGPQHGREVGHLPVQVVVARDGRGLAREPERRDGERPTTAQQLTRGPHEPARGRVRQAVAQVEAAAHDVGERPQFGVVGQRRRLAQQGARPVGHPALPVVGGGRHQAARPHVRSGGEGRGTTVVASRRGVVAPTAGQARGVRQDVRLRVPRARRQRGLVPRAARPRRQDLREHGVGGVAGGQRQFRAQGRPDQRSRVHQRRGLLDRGDPEVRQAHERVDVDVAVHEHHREGPVRGGGEGVQARPQPAAQRAVGWQAGRCGRGAAELVAGQRPGQLHQRQRVAARGVGQVVGEVGGQAGPQVPQHAGARGVVQRPQFHARQPVRGALGRDQHGHRLVLDVGQQVEQVGDVQQVRVVHAQQYPPVAVAAEVRRRSARGAQQGRLAGARLAAQHQGPTAPRTGAIEHRVHGDALPVASKQHGPSCATSRLPWEPPRVGCSTDAPARRGCGPGCGGPAHPPMRAGTVLAEGQRCSSPA